MSATPAGTSRPSGSAAARSAASGARSSSPRSPARSASGRVVSSRRPAEPARPIATISAAPARARPTGVGELDRVLGGGLVPGAVVLLAGEPGVGKSTLLLDVAQQWARRRAAAPSLVVSGEESVSQVRLRAERIGALHEQLYLAAETDLARGARPPRRGQARPAGARLGADHLRPRHRRRRPAASPRSGRSPPRWSRSPRSAASPPSWSATSPRTARSPARGCWSTWSTWCCTSRATSTPRCGWCAGVKNRFGAGRRGRLLRDARGRHHQPAPTRPGCS